jgi:hypothetical protein
LFTSRFDLIWNQNAKDIKKIIKQKRKEENKIKNEKGPQGANPDQQLNGLRPNPPKSKPVPSSPPSLADRWAPPVGLFFNLPVSPALAEPPTSPSPPRALTAPATTPPYSLLSLPISPLFSLPNAPPLHREFS